VFEETHGQASCPWHNSLNDFSQGKSQGKGQKAKVKQTEKRRQGKRREAEGKQRKGEKGKGVNGEKVKRHRLPT